jgi:hypothetical protein
MSRTQLPDRCMSDNDIRRTLEPHVFDGTEAVEAIVTLVPSASRPPNLRTAIGEAQVRRRGPSRRVVDLLSPDP